MDKISFTALMMTFTSIVCTSALVFKNGTPDPLLAVVAAVTSIALWSLGYLVRQGAGQD